MHKNEGRARRDGVTCCHRCSHVHILGSESTPYIVTTIVYRLRRLCPVLTTLFVMSAPALLAQQGPVAELIAAPEALRLAVGASQAVSVSAFDRSGNPLTEIKVAWRSDDPKIATVNQQGLVRGVKAGETEVIARAGDRVVSIPITVRPPAPATAAAAPTEAEGALTLQPPIIDLIPGERRSITPFLRRPSGDVIPTGVVWRATQPWAATVDASGMVTGVARGSGMIMASLGENSASVQARVVDADVAVRPTSLELAVGERDSIRAFIPAQADRALGGGFGWRTTDQTVAKISSTGDIESISPGNTEAVLEGPGVFVRVPLRVIPAASHFEVSPPPSGGVVRVPHRDTRMFVARPLGTDGEALRNAIVQWVIGDTNVVGFDPTTGRLTGKRVGYTTLTANSRGLQQAAWQIEVVPADIAIAPARMGLRAGETRRILARAVNEKGDSLGPPDSLRWTTDRVDVANVGQDGLVTGQTFGVATVTATAPSLKTALSKVYVTGDLLFVSNRAGTPPSVMQTRLSDPDKPTLLLRHGAVNHAVLSPDRTKIAYSTLVDSTIDIYVADADGQNPRRLTSDPGAEREPVWLPDGSAIVYTAESPARSGVEPRSQIMLVLLTGTPRALTSGTGVSSMPTVSADGKRVAFVTSTQGRSDVFEVGTESTILRRHTFTQDRERAPLFLPNGDLLYAVEKGGSSQVFRLPAGSDKPLVFGRVNQSVLSMSASRDGNTVAILSGKLDDGRSKGPLTLALYTSATGAILKTVALRPTEVVAAPTF